MQRHDFATRCPDRLDGRFRWLDGDVAPTTEAPFGRTSGQWRVPCCRHFVTTQTFLDIRPDVSLAPGVAAAARFSASATMMADVSFAGYTAGLARPAT